MAVVDDTVVAVPVAVSVVVVSVENNVRVELVAVFVILLMSDAVVCEEVRVVWLCKVMLLVPLMVIELVADDDDVVNVARLQTLHAEQPFQVHLFDHALLFDSHMLLHSPPVTV